MIFNSRCEGVAAVFLGLCLGITGCLSTFNGDGPSTSPSLTDLQSNRNALGSPNSAPASDSHVQQAGYILPRRNMTVAAGDNVEPAVQGGPGGGVMPPDPNPIPTELNKRTAPPHRVAPSDTLFLEALKLVPKGPYYLDPLEVLIIEVPESFSKQDIKGNFMISPEGTINLGYQYGTVRVGGLTVDQAQLAIRNHLSGIIKNPTVNVALVQMRGMQNVRGEHLVRPDGTIHLGLYGSAYVAGMTLGQVKCVIQNHLAAYLVDPQISVDVFAYNTRKIYIIADGGGYGQQILAIPATGNETVLDAISRAQGLPPTANLHKIWVARPSPAGNPCSQILPVDWKAIVQAGRTETNWQLFPGDRIYIAADPLITVYNYLDKMLAPVERVLGVTLLGATTFQTIRNPTGFGGIGVVR
jgi:polysaccharide export outer membrane protein